jgi:hypothetical protein
MKKPTRFLDKWKIKRQLGKKKYVMRYGFIGFGIASILLFTAVEFISNGVLDMNYLTLRIFLFPTIGIIGASYSWEASETKYRKHVG